MPVNFTLDGFIAQTKSSVKRFCDKVGALLKMLEFDNLLTNRAEIQIRPFKESVWKHNITNLSNFSLVLCDRKSYSFL